MEPLRNGQGQLHALFRFAISDYRKIGANIPIPIGLKEMASTTSLRETETPPLDKGTGTDVRQIALTVLSTLAIIVLLRYAQALFVPIVLSLLIAFALNPFVTILERLRVNRALAALLVVIALFGVVGFGVFALRQQATTVLNSVPDAIAKVRTEIHRYRESPGEASSAIRKLQQTATEIEKTAAEARQVTTAEQQSRVQTPFPAIPINDFLWTGSLGLFGVISDAVMVSFLVFFLLASGDLFKRKIVRLIGTKLSEKRLTLETLQEITALIERFLLIQVLTSICVGLCTAVALWALGLHQPAFWGSAAGVMCSIPYIGPIVIAVVLALDAFVQFGSVAAAAKILVVPVLIFSLEGLLVKPAVMGKAARINGAAMFIGLLFWSWIWGLIGVVVAVPIMMVIKTICDRVDSLRPVGELLDEN
jgi:predicted PurR-regulated permease PerM